MDDFKLNAAKMIAAQQKQRNGARSPESDSNWDSSEPENTLPNISSEEDVSTVSTHSRRREKNATPKAPKQPSSTKHQSQTHPQGNKPVMPHHLAINGEQSPKKSSPASSMRSGQGGKATKAGVNVFVDRGSVDSSDDDFSVASKKSVPRKPERPPFDFRNAITEPQREDVVKSERPGKSRKGKVYDPSPEKMNQSINSDQKQLIVDTPDGKPKKKNWKVNLGFQSTENDATMNDNNNLSYSQRDMGMLTTAMSSDVELKKMEGRMSQMSEKDAGDDLGKYDEAGLENSHLLIKENTQRYIYRYNHGSMKYYDTRTGREDIYMTAIADKSEKLVRRCAREVFGALRIVVDFFLIFLLEFLRFLAYNIIGLFLVGLLTTFGDYLFKPVLAALFNSILQPVAVFLYNTGVALQTVFKPLIDILRGVFTQIAMLLRALRLVEINWKRGPEQNTLRSMEEV
ncbi:uncharacterized protein LOC117305150 [Asterias rubens]|uniref:uncharacterized protein LOC117305150 n=1 Tax=Asterias rubens TaxID=7604 RepID=UPI001455652D|nr:uncharacterized protein LOC117305150 [Asterias rubens]